MNKPKIIALKGLPASGKSTFAKKLVEQGFVRTNKDTIREELFGGVYKRRNEKEVVQERNRQIIEALEQGSSVVVDDTNLNPVHIKDLLSIAKEYNAVFEVDDSFLAVPIGVCIERDKNREDSVGEQVIREMYHKFVKKSITAVKYDPDLSMVVIVDIDGTLAHMDGKRKPYDWHKVGVDEVDAGVAHLVDAIKCIDYAKVFIFSGRSDICKPETEEWLERHDIEYDILAMRPHALLQEKDVFIKREMFEQHVRGKYNVLFVVDDRPQVCRMWRDELGLRVLQVGDPYFEF